MNSLVYDAAIQKNRSYRVRDKIIMGLGLSNEIPAQYKLCIKHNRAVLRTWGNRLDHADALCAFCSQGYLEGGAITGMTLITKYDQSSTRKP